MKYVFLTASILIALSGAAFAMSCLNGTGLNMAGVNGTALNSAAMIDLNSLRVARAVIKR
jgi:hypothetical protein